MKKILFSILFIGLWVSIDSIAHRVSIQGFATPWYPQVALSIVLLLSGGLRWVWLVFVAKIISSVVVWPGNIIERILPNLVFAAGIFLICYYILELRKNPNYERFTFVKALGVSALVLFGVATFRSLYYAKSFESDLTVMSAIFHNWLADFTSMICLTPGLSIIVDPLRKEYLKIGLQYLKKYWYFLAVIIILECILMLMPVHLHERLWYITFLPCIGFAVVSGLEGTILLVFLVNIFLGGIAVSTFSNKATTDMQVFFLSMNILLCFLGFLSSDRRQRIVNILKSNREYIHSQFNKVNTLILMQTEISQHLKAILKDMENFTSTENVSVVAKDFLNKIDHFFANLEFKQATNKNLKYFETMHLKQRIRENIICHLPSNIPFPGIEISKRVPVQLEMDIDFFDTIIRQMINLVYQINPDSNSKSEIFVDWKNGELHIEAKIYGSMKSVQTQNISFMSAYWSFQRSLPTGGFALTSYILHALAARIGGEFWLQPLWFSHEDVLVAEFIMPIGVHKSPSRNFRL